MALSAGATNEILVFGYGGSVASGDMLTEADYAGDSDIVSGNRQGLARRELVNTTLKQATIIASALGQFVARRCNSHTVSMGGDGEAIMMRDLFETQFEEALFHEILSGTGTAQISSTIHDTPNIIPRTTATGKLNFDTTGLAAQATRLATPRAIIISGQAFPSSSQANFDGSGNTTITINKVNATSLEGTVPLANLPTVLQSASVDPTPNSLVQRNAQSVSFGRAVSISVMDSLTDVYQVPNTTVTGDTYVTTTCPATNNGVAGAGGMNVFKGTVDEVTGSKYFTATYFTRIDGDQLTVANASGTTYASFSTQGANKINVSGTGYTMVLNSATSGTAGVITFSTAF